MGAGQVPGKVGWWVGGVPTGEREKRREIRWKREKSGEWVPLPM